MLMNITATTLTAEGAEASHRQSSYPTTLAASRWLAAIAAEICQHMKHGVGQLACS
jgi:hypothetical protein